MDTDMDIRMEWTDTFLSCLEKVLKENRKKNWWEWKDTFISFPFLEFFLPDKYKTEKSDGVKGYILPIVAGWTVADGKAPWN